MAEYTGATFDWTFDQSFSAQLNWYIDGNGITADTQEVATPRTLTLGFRVTTQTLENDLRPLKPNEGKVDTLPQDTGGFVAVGRANGNNAFQLDPPSARRPLRQPGTYHVARYEEQLVSQDVGEWDVEIEFVKAGDRTDTPTINEQLSGAAFPLTFDQPFGRRSVAAWELQTPLGAIVTDRIDAEFAGTGADGVERYELTARLTFEQAHAFEAAYPRIAGTRVKAIPDASNVMVDDTGGDATVTVDAPGGSVVSDGDYAITEWESARINDAYQNLAMTLAVK